MNIVVCMKETPDTTADKRFTPDMRLDRGAVPGVINPYDEYGIEEAIAQRDKLGGEVTLLCMGPARAEDSIRKALAMGVDKAVLVSDPALEGSDIVATAHVLAAALQKIPYDLIIFGQGTTDSNGGMVAVMVAELLGLPALTWAGNLTIEGGKAVIKRAHETGYDVVEAPLPCVVSVTQVINTPRYPSLKGIMQAKKKEIASFPLADLGIDAGSVGSAGASTKVDAAARVTLNRTPEIFKDADNAAVYIADFLAKRKLI